MTTGEIKEEIDEVRERMEKTVTGSPTLTETSIEDDNNIIFNCTCYTLFDSFPFTQNSNSKRGVK
jgi:hypothetical protein